MSALEAWADYHRQMSSIAAEMIGAAIYLDDHPEYATDERCAEVFREYAARFQTVEVP